MVTLVFIGGNVNIAVGNKKLRMQNNSMGSII